MRPQELVGEMAGCDYATSAGQIIRIRLLGVTGRIFAITASVPEAARDHADFSKWMKQVFETTLTEPDHPLHSSQSQWIRRIRDELLRIWPSSWVLAELHHITALLPLALVNSTGHPESETTILTRLERVLARLQSGQGTVRPQATR